MDFKTTINSPAPLLPMIPPGIVFYMKTKYNRKREKGLSKSEFNFVIQAVVRNGRKATQRGIIMKKTFAFALFLIIALAVFSPVSAVHAEEAENALEEELDEGILFDEEEATSGKCGDKATWSVTGKGDNLTLSIKGSGPMYDYSEGGAPWYNAYRSSIQKVQIAEGITYIGDYCFYNLVSIPEVTIPGSVKTVGKNTFSYCNHLEKAVLEKGVTEIGEGMFLYCFELKDIEIHKGIRSIGDRAFLSDMDLEEITLPKTLESIGVYAFSGCTALKSPLIFGRNTKKIGTYAFSSCTKVPTIVMKGDPPEFGDKCFNSMKAYAYHPAENDNWAAARQNYGGKLTWLTFSVPQIKGTWPENNSDIYDHSMNQFRIQYEDTVAIGDGWVEIRDMENPQTVFEKIHIAEEPDEDEAAAGVLIDYVTDSDITPRSILMISISFDKQLLPGHTYAISVGEDVVSPIINNSRLETPLSIEGYSEKIESDKWTFQTIKIDYMHFKNIEEAIEDNVYDRVFPEKPKKRHIKSRDSGTGGTCFGWCYLVGAFENQFNNAKGLCTELYPTDKEILKEYIQTTHLYQYTNRYENSRKESGIDTLSDAIKGHINGTGPKIIVNVHNNATLISKGNGHALYPVKILEENDSEIRVLVLDCNGKELLSEEFGFNNSPAGTYANASNPLILKKKNGKVSEFEYQVNGRYFTGKIDYNVIDEAPDKCFTDGNTAQPNMIFGRPYLNGTFLTELSSVCENSADDDFEFLYWTEEEQYTLDTENIKNELDKAFLGIADSNHSSKVFADTGSLMNVGLAGKYASLNSADGSECAFSVEFEEYSDDGNFRNIIMSSKTMSSFSAENTEKGYVVNAPDRMDMTVSSGYRSANVTIPEGTILIRIEDDKVIIYSDEDSDGEFEKEESEQPLTGSLPVAGFKITEDSIELPAGKTTTLSAVFEPADATNKKIIWKSSNPKAAVVDENGIITGKAVGNTLITGVTEDGGYSDSCNVRVLFSDVTNKNLAAYNAIYWGVEKGFVNGYGSYFDINGECTRAQFVLFLWRAAGKPAAKATTLKFKDAADIEKLAPDYKKAILWGSEKGVVAGFTSGVNAGKFLPNDPCTRGQVVTFLWRYDGQKAAKAGAKSFPDVPKTHKYYKAIMWASSYGITTGFSDGKFKPEQTCTRGQCVTFLYRMLK